MKNFLNYLVNDSIIFHSRKSLVWKWKRIWEAVSCREVGRESRECPTYNLFTMIQTTPLHDGEVRDLIDSDLNVRHKQLHHIVAARLAANGNKTTPTLLKEKAWKGTAPKAKIMAKATNKLIMLQSSIKKAKRPKNYSLIDTDDVVSTEMATKHQELQPTTPLVSLSRHVSLKQCSIHQEGVAGSQALWVLHLHIVSAEKVHNADGVFSKSDPYVQVSVLLNTPSVSTYNTTNTKKEMPRSIALTPVVKSTTKPCWNYETDVSLAMNNNQTRDSLSKFYLFADAFFLSVQCFFNVF